MTMTPEEKREAAEARDYRRALDRNEAAADRLVRRQAATEAVERSRQDLELWLTFLPPSTRSRQNDD